MIDIIEIMVHWYAGRSRNELSASLGVDRKTIRKYLAPAVAAGMVPGGPPVEEAEWRRLVIEWFPELAETRLRQVTWPHIEKRRDYIAEQLKANVTMATIHQRLVDEHGLACSAPSLRRWVRANLPEDLLRSRVTVLKDTLPPGQEAQIDYGKLGMWPDPASGRRRTVWAFVMVLPASRHMFVAAGAVHGVTLATTTPTPRPPLPQPAKTHQTSLSAGALLTSRRHLPELGFQHGVEDAAVSERTAEPSCDDTQEEPLSWPYSMIPAHATLSTEHSEDLAEACVLNGCYVVPGLQAMSRRVGTNGLPHHTRQPSPCT